MDEMARPNVLRELGERDLRLDQATLAQRQELFLLLASGLAAVHRGMSLHGFVRITDSGREALANDYREE